MELEDSDMSSLYSHLLQSEQTEEETSLKRCSVNQRLSRFRKTSLPSNPSELFMSQSKGNGNQTPNGSPSHSVNSSTQTLRRRASVTLSTPRKLSTTSLLQEPTLSMYTAAHDKTRETHVADATLRKISQVSHALTSTFGWTPSPSRYDVVVQSRTLCGRYIRSKVRSSYRVGKKVSLQRLKSVTNLSAIVGPTLTGHHSDLLAVSGHLRRLGFELERGHPKIFNSVCANVGLHAVQNESTIQNLLHSVARELFRNEINWGRVVALFVVSGALAVDCVKLGRPEFVLGLVDVVADVVEQHLAGWIVSQGGWDALQSQFRQSRSFQLFKVVFHFILPTSLVALLLYAY